MRASRVLASESPDCMNPKQSEKSESKPIQMKVLLSREEHTIVTTAANLKQLTVAEYMKTAVMIDALKTAKELTKLIENSKYAF